MTIQFFVPGLPVGAGSKKAFAIKKGGVYTGRCIVTDDTGEPGKHWRSEIASFAFAAMKENNCPPLDEAVILKAEFVMPRPKHHFGTGKNASVLKPNAPAVHTSMPDATKLVRALEDSLKHICWRDDNLVCEQHVYKVYGDVPGCTVTILPWADEQVIRNGMESFALTD